MTEQVTVKILSSVEEINQSVRRTNVLLRAANALRLSVRDIQQVVKSPNLSNIMWTLIQISRTYNALRRLYRISIKEINKMMGITRSLGKIKFITPEPIPIPIAETMSWTLGDLAVRVEAFRDNIPIRLQEINLTTLPDETRVAIQRLLEEDAEETVVDAQEILTARILHPDVSTGDLAASIGWMPEVDGVRVFANMFYAHWVEEGQRTFMGHHYMKGATDLARQRLPFKIRERLNQLISEEM